MKVLKILALVYVFLLIVLLNRTLEDKGCINSMIVQSINIERADGPLFVPSCYFDQAPAGTPILGDKKLISQLEDTIQSFEKFVRTNKLFIKPNSISVVIRDDAEFSVSASEIILNKAQASNQKQFRKSLLKSWFLTFASPKIRDDKFSQEVVSDIFLYVFWNDLSWTKESNFKRWLKYVYSERDICKTKFAPLERTSFCELVESSNGDKDFDLISLWSLRPLVVNRILSYYDQMTYSQKLEFTKYWMRFVATFAGELPKQYLTFQNFSSVYNGYMEQFVGALLNVQFDEPLSLDYVFEFDVPQPYTMIDFQSDLPFYQYKNIVFKFQKSTFINVKNGSKISSNKAKARHWVLVQKSLPNLKQIKKYPAEYLTIIQAKQDYDFSQFYKKVDDISSFPWKEEFDSLTIYLPSLKLLGHLAPHLKVPQDIMSLSRDDKVTKVLGWSPVQ